VTARSFIPWGILGLLTVLAVGSAALALSESSTDANTTVHSASAATYSASSFVLQPSIKGEAAVGALVFRAPSTFTQFRSGSSGTVVARITGVRGAAYLKQTASITAGDGWSTGNNGQYVRTESLAELNARTHQAPETGVTGSVHQTVSVANGQLIGIVLDVSATEAGRTIQEVETLHFVRINGQPTPPLPSSN
jgi:hypothetical protein